MTSRPFRSLHVVAASLALALPIVGAAAQSATSVIDPSSVMPGFTPIAAAHQRVLEDETIRRPSASSARVHSSALSAETHVAGTPAQARTRDYVLTQMRVMGLETEVRSYSVFMPHATSVRLW